MNVSNNFHQVRKWSMEVLIALVIVFVIWLAHGINQMEASIDKANQLEARVGKMEAWVDDWYNVLKVPERDQKQDSQILEFRQRIDRLEAWRDSTQNP